MLFARPASQVVGGNVENTAEHAKFEVGDFAKAALDMGDDLPVYAPAEKGAFGGKIVLRESCLLAQRPHTLTDGVSLPRQMKRAPMVFESFPLVAGTFCHAGRVTRAGVAKYSFER